MNGLALCAGYGGLELAIERGLNGYRTVCYVEGETYAASHLIKKMEEGRLHNAPVWSNVRTFDGETWRGKVDIITGGFPCQPYSSAGKQLGEEDPRDLWRDFKRIIGQVRPKIIFLENVPGVVKWRLNEIVLDLDELGYDAAWCIMAASQIGALHQRKRWFMLAIEKGISSNADNSSKFASPRTIRQKNRYNARRICSNVSNSDSCTSKESQRTSGEISPKGRRLEERKDKGKAGGIIGGLCSHVSNADSKRGLLQSERKLSSLEMFSCYGKERTIDQWAGKFESFWQVEPSMGRLVDGAPDWVDKLRLLGNGVVPQQAYSAFQTLAFLLLEGMDEKRTPKDCLESTS